MSMSCCVSRTELVNSPVTERINTFPTEVDVLACLMYNFGHLAEVAIVYSFSVGCTTHKAWLILLLLKFPMVQSSLVTMSCHMSTWAVEQWVLPSIPTLRVFGHVHSLNPSTHHNYWHDIPRNIEYHCIVYLVMRRGGNYTAPFNYTSNWQYFKNELHKLLAGLAAHCTTGQMQSVGRGIVSHEVGLQDGMAFDFNSIQP